MNDEPVPLEVAVLVLDGNMRSIDNYSTPVIPSLTYDLSMVSMHSPAHLVNALEDEGLWATMQANSMDIAAADRYIADKIKRHCAADETRVVVLCDTLESTRKDAFRFLPTSTRMLERRATSWLEIGPLKAFAESERIYGETAWKSRAAARAKAVANYAHQMRLALMAGASSLV